MQCSVRYCVTCDGGNARVNTLWRSCISDAVTVDDRALIVFPESYFIDVYSNSDCLLSMTGNAIESASFTKGPTRFLFNNIQVISLYSTIQS